MKLTTFSAFVLFLSAYVATVMPVAAQQPVAVLVLRIEGADSLTIEFGSSHKTLRLDGIRVAPCMAAEANNRLYGLAAGRAAQLDYDRASYAQTGQLSGYAWVDGIMLNLVLVSEGYAARDGGVANVTYDRDIATAELSARSQKLGLWSRCP
jgi:endonuclease YncB( thermonuclease family)